MHHNPSKKKTSKHISDALIIALVIVIFFGTVFVALPKLFAQKYDRTNGEDTTENENTPSDNTDATEGDTKEPVDPTLAFTPQHIETPDEVRAIYMTSWVAGTPKIREPIIQFILDSEINAVVIDIKDDTGRISFDVYDPELEAVGSEEIRIADLRELIDRLHDNDIYVIGRVSVFQDPYFTKLHPEQAVKRASDGEVWKDRKGISWMDASSELVWNYALAIGKEAYRAGFDEINYDYIRFPSDGNMQDIYYPFSEAKITADPRDGKAQVIKSFFEFITTELKAYQPYKGHPRPVVSADLFGMTTSNADDLGIGQKLEYALPYFDYVAPMVYPSHYPTGFIGLSNPAANPYEVIDYAMSSALYKIEKLKQSASTTPEIYENVYPDKIRPWLQDFDLGAHYTPEMVREQIQATYDNGLDSYMIWDASNTYTKGAFKPYWQDTLDASP